jgi:hypothetical protein
MGRVRLISAFAMICLAGTLSGGTPELLRTDSTLTITADGRPLLTYVIAVTRPPEGVDPLFGRGAYIHPLRSPGGEVLTRIQPPDHYHHYGIWNPWTRVRIGERVVDFWNLGEGQGTVRFAEYLGGSETKDEAGFRVRQEHICFLKDGTGQVAINEVWDVRIHHIETHSYIVDLVTTLNTPLEGGVVLEAYRYGGGLGFRATERWNTANSTVLTSEGRTRADADSTGARWVLVEGESSVHGGRSGILFMSHPGNRAHPEPMRMWPPDQYDGIANVFFEFCPIRHQEWKLEQGREYTLRYRMVVFDGAMGIEQAEKHWSTF